MFFLDGHNNPGFSGGPIVYRDLNQTGSPVFHVAAVISGYQPEFEPVRRPRELEPGEVVAPKDQQYVVTTPDGKKFLMAEAGTYVRLNTGIVKGFDIKYAVELIRKNPSGPKATDQFESKYPGGVRPVVCTIRRSAAKRHPSPHLSPSEQSSNVLQALLLHPCLAGKQI